MTLDIKKFKNTKKVKDVEPRIITLQLPQNLDLLKRIDFICWREGFKKKSFVETLLLLGLDYYEFQSEGCEDDETECD